MLIAKAVAAALIVTSFASPATERAYQDKAEIESARAACMKGYGLAYLPEEVVKHQWTKEERARVTGDYEAMRAHRAKYGFGVWSKLVYPEKGTESRNNKIMMALSPGALKTWRARDEQCFSKAVKTVLGKSVTSQEDFHDRMNAALAKELRAVDRDRKIVELGEGFASCLGVARDTPAKLAERGANAFRKEATEVAKSRHKGALPKGLDREGAWMWPSMTPEEARPYLDKEVEAALADLECGKAFYQAYLPRARAVQERVYQEYAIDWAL